MAEMREGRMVIDEAGHEIYYRLFGEGSETLMCLAGGPGGNAQYLTRLGELAGDGFQVLIHDQLGTGKSDRPDDPSLWNFPRFVEEVETVRTKLGLGRVHLYGQSWGGMLALQYALDHPEGVTSLIPSNIGASTAEIVREMWQHRLELPAEVLRTLAKYEGSQDFENPEMGEAILQYYARFTRRATPFDLETSIKEFNEMVMPVFEDMGPAYQAMWGPCEFICTGPLMEWDITDRLHEIKAPTLILAGWYDECGLETHRVMADRIPDNEYVIFGNSSHCVILEKEADAYLGVIKDFIRRVIARS